MTPPAKIDMLLAIPTRGSTRIEWTVALTMLSQPVNTSYMMRVFPGMALLDARNAACKTLMEINGEYLFFLDDDVVCPPQTIRKMVSTMEQQRDIALVTGIVPAKTNPPEPCIFAVDRPGPYWDWTFGEIFDIRSCGMACCMIRRSALDAVGEPWFGWTSNNNGRELNEVGEDIGFCEALAAKGLRIVADGSLLCGHLDDVGKVHQLSADCAPLKRGMAKLQEVNSITNGHPIPKDLIKPESVELVPA